MNKPRHVGSKLQIEELSIASGDKEPASNAWKPKSKLQVVAGILLLTIFLATLVIEYKSISNQLREDGRASSSFDNKREFLTRFQDAIINEDLDQIRSLLISTPEPFRTDVLFHVYCKDCTIRHVMDLSVASGNLNLISEIIRNITITPEQRGQLLETALHFGHSNIANMLTFAPFKLQIGIDRNNFLVKQAISIGATELAETIALTLALGPQPITNPSNVDLSGWTPLMHRIYEQNIRTASNLIANGANVNFRDADGNTPLIVAASVGFVEGVDLLIQNGADYFAINHDGISAFEAAKYTQHMALADLLNKKKNEAVRVIQEGLYNLRYDPGPIDGRLGNKTISAIKQYQERNNLPIDGHPTLEIYHNLNGATLPGPWGAIAYGLEGYPMSRHSRSSRMEAEEGLRYDCEMDGKFCPLMYVINGNECIALAKGNEEFSTGTGVGIASNIKDASETALENCDESTTYCLIRIFICADGRHLHYD